MGRGGAPAAGATLLLPGYHTCCDPCTHWEPSPRVLPCTQEKPHKALIPSGVRPAVAGVPTSLLALCGGWAGGAVSEGQAGQGQAEDSGGLASGAGRSPPALLLAGRVGNQVVAQQGCAAVGGRVSDRPRGGTWILTDSDAGHMCGYAKPPWGHPPPPQESRVLECSGGSWSSQGLPALQAAAEDPHLPQRQLSGQCQQPALSTSREPCQVGGQHSRTTVPHGPHPWAQGGRP